MILDRLLAGDLLMTIMSDTVAERARDVARLGIALEILEAHGRDHRPGPRAVTWSSLGDAEQIRILTRIWSVDETVARAVPLPVRRGVVSALRLIESGRWYHTNDIARAAASLVSKAAGRPIGTVPATEPGESVDRPSIDRSLIALAVIGVVEISIDERGRPAALRLTEAGDNAVL